MTDSYPCVFPTYIHQRDEYSKETKPDICMHLRVDSLDQQKHGIGDGDRIFEVSYCRQNRAS